MNRKARIDRKIQVLTEQSNVARFRLRLAQQAVASTDLHPDLRGLAELELTAARDAATTLDRDIAITHMTRNIYPHMMEGSIILVVSADGATAECWEKIDPSQHSGSLGGLSQDQPGGWWIRPSDPDKTPEPFHTIIRHECHAVDDAPTVELEHHRLFTSEEVDRIVDTALAYE